MYEMTVIGNIRHLLSFTFGLFFVTLISSCASTSPGSGAEGSSAPILPWQSSGLKVGYIRSDIISDKYPDYRDADVELRHDNRRWLEEAEEMEQEIRHKETELDDLALILSDERKKELEDNIVEARRDLQKFRHNTWYDENSNYIQRRRELMEPIDARVNDAIWKVAEEKKLDIVFDTVAGNIVYVKPGLDITQDVLEELTK